MHSPKKSRSAGKNAVSRAPQTPKKPIRLAKVVPSHRASLPSPQEYLPVRPWVHGEFDFNNLFIFELANNHQGDVAHGRRIIDEVAAEAQKYGIRGAIKLQLRELNTFIHPDHKKKTDNKHIPRFLSTRLNERGFEELLRSARARGFLTMATPFDEASVDLLEKLGVDIIKVASCSATDWPLLERIAQAGKPVICSTAGVAIEDVDRIVSFFQHRAVQFALMHCVALYPTPAEKLNLNRIEQFIKRYRSVPVGFSTHEEPSNTSAVRVAYAKGARIFEKHVAIPTAAYSINAYSATPTQIGAWLAAWRETADMLTGDGITTAGADEEKSLRDLKRGVFAKRPLKAGVLLTAKDVYFAMPATEGQLVSGIWKDTMIADRDYKINEAVGEVAAASYKKPRREIIASYTRALKGLLREGNVPVGFAPDVELSHHYGLDRFNEYGTTIIDCINREYCKKILIQLPGQQHPLHYHRKKEEAFQVLYGELTVTLEGKEKQLFPGDVIIVPRGAWHSFKSTKGAIFEEISTTHFNDDSFYADQKIASLPREVRKTKLQNWGRFQFED